MPSCAHQEPAVGQVLSLRWHCGGLTLVLIHRRLSLLGDPETTDCGQEEAEPSQGSSASEDCSQACGRPTLSVWTDRKGLSGPGFGYSNRRGLGLLPKPNRSFDRAGSVGVGEEVGTAHTSYPLNSSDHAGNCWLVLSRRNVGWFVWWGPLP